ncbi:interleukin-17 receptor A isoform X2 [Acanthochromis polyacanthus]|nr:interleukin-17 receptor A isoform X2 [Acanthochromis polyacanthus]XP_051808007.1 interleukin-17 receptor A isoform X2 [Acanthochromis polyacanthus]
MVARIEDAPSGPEWDPEHEEVGMDRHGLVPVMNVTWRIKADASIRTLRGSELNIVEESTNQRVCMQFSYRIKNLLTPNYSRWTFSLNEVVVEPGYTYMVSVFNLPQPEIGEYMIRKRITIPGCGNKRIQKVQLCQENGSLWDSNIPVAVLVNRKPKMLSIFVGFNATQYSERYQVSIQSGGFFRSKNVSKENRTSLNVTFEFGLWQLSQCEMSVTIQAFFIRCKNECWSRKKTIYYCPYYPLQTLILGAALGLLVIGSCLSFLLWRTFHKDPPNTSSPADKDQPEIFQLQQRKRVLIIYSLDHPLYKNIILKLCAFLATKCGTEVVLDLLDSTRLGVLGSIQWLEWHKEQIENSSDKILILCSRGVQAKWRAMCGDKQVFMRQDACSLVGDMLTPSLSLLVPHFIRSTSFKKYIVAYFDDVCSEDDIPSPFNVTVRYKLMKQFEEVFFRILDTEKHEPGRMKQIEGLSEDKYHQCPSGRALCDAIQAFHAYQQEHPRWFEDELMESSELEVEENSDEIYRSANLTTYYVHDS